MTPANMPPPMNAAWAEDRRRGEELRHSTPLAEVSAFVDDRGYSRLRTIVQGDGRAASIRIRLCDPALAQHLVEWWERRQSQGVHTYAEQIDTMIRDYFAQQG